MWESRGQTHAGVRSVITKPIGVTIGDPSGIGPEIALRAIHEYRTKAGARPVVLIGSQPILEDIIDRLHLPQRLTVVDAPGEAVCVASAVPLLDVPHLSLENFSYGVASPQCAVVATAYVTRATQLALAGQLGAVVCAPVSKQALMMADGTCIGHAEYIANLCGTTDHGMLCVGDDLAVMPVTGHIGIEDVASRLTSETILSKLRLGVRAFRWVYGRTPRVLVCSLNPHGGEGGYLGRVDIDIVTPAIATARAEGMVIDGPLASDAAFRPYIRKRYDLIVGMYHDQVKTAIAALDSDRFVALLAGVGIIRTTTTHGVANDIAGLGKADPTNMRRAIELAAKLIARPVPQDEAQIPLQRDLP